MTSYNRIKRLPAVIQAAVVFVVYAGLAAIQLFNGERFSLYDGWYHFERTTMFPSDAFFHQSLPTVEATLNTWYADLHWLYHAALKPFSALGGHAGYSFGHVLLVGCTGVALYAVINELTEDDTLLLTSLTVLSPAFIPRLSLPRSISLGLLIFLVGIYLLCTNQEKLLGLLAVISVWSYTSWVLLAYAVIIYHALQWWNDSLTWQDALPYLGFITGLLLNPFFPSNIVMTAQQLFLTVLPAVQGGEWAPLPFNAYLHVLPLLILTGWSAWRTDLDRTTVFTAILAATFLGLSFTTKRAITYLVPTLLLLTAATWQPRSESVQRFLLAAIIPFVVLGGVATINSLQGTANNTPLTDLAPCIDAANSAFEDDATLYNARWDDFPRLYDETPFAYATGLDPSFTYLHNQTTYQELIGSQDVTTEGLQEYGFDGVISRHTAGSATLSLRLSVSELASRVKTTKHCYVFRLER